MNRITALQRDGFVTHLKFDTAFEDKAHFFTGMRDQCRLARFCRQFEQEVSSRCSPMPKRACARHWRPRPSMERHRLTAPRDTRASGPRLRCRRTIRPAHPEGRRQFQRLPIEHAMSPRSIRERNVTDSPTIPASSSSVKPRAERALRMTAPIAARRAASRARRPISAETTLLSHLLIRQIVLPNRQMSSWLASPAQAN